MTLTGLSSKVHKAIGRPDPHHGVRTLTRNYGDQRNEQAMP